MAHSRIARITSGAGSALQVLALMGAGIGASTMLAAPAIAQDYQNVTASGRVISTDGTAISGATVKVTSNDQGFTRTTTTSGGGAYRVPQLPPGSYTFEITAPNFETFVDNNVQITTDQAGNQFALSPAGGAEGNVIVVTAGRQEVVDFENTTTGKVIDIGELQTRVPVQRSLRDVILLAPGTTQGSSSQNARFSGQAQISGASFAENAYYINGLNVTEFRQGFSPVTVPFDFYETVDVKTGGFQAEFGRATGGVVNATTKSGSNEYHAGLLFNYEPNWLQGDAPNSFQDDNDGDRSDRYDTVVTLSGPIIKDKLFIFGLYNSRYSETFNGTADGTNAAGDLDPTQNTGRLAKTVSPFYAFKVDAVPLDGQRLEFTYFQSRGETTTRSFNYNSDTNSIGSSTGSSTNLYGGENYVGRYTGNFSDFLTVSAAYGKNKNRNTTLPANIVDPRVLDSRFSSGVEVPGTNPNGQFQSNDDTREFYRGDVDLFFDLLGSHHVRFGYDREELTAVQLSTPTGGGLYEIFRASGTDTDISNLPAGTDYFSRRFFQNGGSFNNVNEAYYIQDNWTLFNDRLNLQLGIRNDKFSNANADGDVFYDSGNQWGPRFGFSADPFGDKLTKVYGSFGRYFLPIPANTNIRLAGAELDFQEFFVFGGFDANGVPIEGAPVNGVDNAVPCPNGAGNNCNVTGDGTADDVASVVSTALDPQSLDEYIIGIERRLGEYLKVGINYTHRSLNDSLEDSAIDLAVRKLCTSEGITGCERVYIGFVQYVLNNPGKPITVDLARPLPGETSVRQDVTFTPDQLGYPEARRTYDAVTFNFDREYDGIWSLSGSYTWSRLKGNIEGGVKSDIGQVDSGLTQDFDTPGLTDGSYGFLPGHRRHTFKLFGSYAITDWLTLGGNALVASPRKFGCLGVVPASVDPVASLYGPAGNYCQGQLVPRGTAFESDWQKEFNVSFIARLPVDFDASLRFDVFNIFDDDSELDFYEFGDLGGGQPDPNYQRPLGFQSPRSARIQLRVGF